MLDGLVNPFTASSASGAANAGTSEDVLFELGGGPDKLQGSRAERRCELLSNMKSPPETG
jgi:hypothetical protein